MPQGTDHMYKASFRCVSFCGHSETQAAYTVLGTGCICTVCFQSETENGGLDWFWFETFFHTGDTEMADHRYEATCVLSE